MRKTYMLYKAAPIGKTHVNDLALLFEKEIPEMDTLEKAAGFYEFEADDIAKALIDTLPGGVLDRLTAKLLIHKSSLLRISTGENHD